MAPTGGGKSFFLVNLGFGALAAGKNVIHYTFELSETHVGNRYDSRITGVPTKELRSRMVEAENKLARFMGGQLFIKEYPPKVATINTIKFHMGRLLSNGFDPDLIIIDYGDLMRSRRGYDQKRFELESIFEDLRALSMEMKLPIWTATQSNREGFNDDVITIDKVGEAINKAMVVDFFGTLPHTIFTNMKFTLGKGAEEIYNHRFINRFPNLINSNNIIVETFAVTLSSCPNRQLHLHRQRTKIFKNTF
jgi:hypothetical protein